MNKMKRIYVFSSLAVVMLVTISLTFFMNIQFIQKQLRENLLQEIEYTREMYKLRLINIEDAQLEEDFQSLFQGDLRSSSIRVLLYNDYGKNFAGNISQREDGINNIKTMMLNGIEETLYEGETFYSFTNVNTRYGDVYLMLEMSDQEYIEGIRNYYFRTLLVFVLVSVSILLMGFKLIDLLKTEKESLNLGGTHGKNKTEKESKRTKG
jgi:hypothetical protein